MSDPAGPVEGAVEQPVPEQGPASSWADLPFQDRHKMARDTIPAFSGKSNSDYNVDSFVTKLHTAFDTFAIAPRDQVNLALTRLEGEATRYQTEMRDTGTTPTEFSDLCVRLRQRFPVPLLETAPYLLIHGVAMKSGNLAQYSQNFSRHVARLGEAEAGRTSLLQELYLTGLDYDLRKVVEQARPENGWSTLSALQSACVTAHQNLHLQGSRPKPENSGSSQGSGKRGRAETKTGRSCLARGSEVDTSLWCSRCNKAGHEVDDCWTEHPEKRPSKQAKTGGGGGYRGRGKGPGRGYSGPPSKN